MYNCRGVKRDSDFETWNCRGNLMQYLCPGYFHLIFLIDMPMVRNEDKGNYVHCLLTSI